MRMENIERDIQNLAENALRAAGMQPIDIERVRIVSEIVAEIVSAYELWPTWPRTRDDQGWALSIIGEELGEAMEPFNDYRNGKEGWTKARSRMHHKLVQTAAMCIRMIENLPPESEMGTLP